MALSIAVGAFQWQEPRVHTCPGLLHNDTRGDDVIMMSLLMTDLH